MPDFLLKRPSSLFTHGHTTRGVVGAATERAIVHPPPQQQPEPCSNKIGGKGEASKQDAISVVTFDDRRQPRKTDSLHQPRLTYTTRWSLQRRNMPSLKSQSQVTWQRRTQQLPTTQPQSTTTLSQRTAWCRPLATQSAANIFIVHIQRQQHPSTDLQNIIIIDRHHSAICYTIAAAVSSQLLDFKACRFLVNERFSQYPGTTSSWSNNG